MTGIGRSTINCAVGLLAIVGMRASGCAQVLSGSLTGKVTDPGSAGVPGVLVEALYVGAGVSRQTVQNNWGLAKRLQGAFGFAD
jgi:hypothetical protein